MVSLKKIFARSLVALCCMALIGGDWVALAETATTAETNESARYQTCIELKKINAIKDIDCDKFKNRKVDIQGKKSKITVAGQSKYKDIGTFIAATIDLLVKLAGTVAFVLLAAGGLRMVVAGGSEGENQKAKDMIQYAVIGLVLALLAFVIISSVQGILFR